MSQIIFVDTGQTIIDSKVNLLKIFNEGFHHSTGKLHRKIHAHEHELHSLEDMIENDESKVPIISSTSYDTVELMFHAARLYRSNRSIYDLSIEDLKSDFKLMQDGIYNNVEDLAPSPEIAKSNSKQIYNSAVIFSRHIVDFILVLTPIKSLAKSDNNYLREGISVLESDVENRVSYHSDDIVRNMDIILDQVKADNFSKQLKAVKR